MAQTAAASNSGLSKIDVAQIRSRLLALRAELSARGSARDLLHLKRVESALGKMSRGFFGICESCVRPVGKIRLLEAPDVRYCEVCSGGQSASSSPLAPRAPAVFPFSAVPKPSGA